MEVNSIFLLLGQYELSSNSSTKELHLLLKFKMLVTLFFGQITFPYSYTLRLYLSLSLSLTIPF